MSEVTIPPMTESDSEMVEAALEQLARIDKNHESGIIDSYECGMQRREVLFRLLIQ